MMDNKRDMIELDKTIALLKEAIANPVIKEIKNVVSTFKIKVSVDNINKVTLERVYDAVSSGNVEMRPLNIAGSVKVVDGYYTFVESLPSLEDLTK